MLSDVTVLVCSSGVLFDCDSACMLVVCGLTVTVRSDCALSDFVAVSAMRA